MLKKHFSLFLAALAAAACLVVFAGCSTNGTAQSPRSESGDKVSVVASFYPMYDFAQKVGGDRVDVT